MAVKLNNLPGAKLGGRFVVGPIFGWGAHGIVYRCTDTQDPERALVVKTPRPELSDNPEIIAAIRNEALVLSQLDHPHIPKLVAFGNEPPYLVMDMIEGEEPALKPRPVHEVARMMAGVLAALAHCQVRGVVHRDVKPENIRVNHLGRGFLTDFSSAVHYSSPRSTPQGMRKGTPGFIDPCAVDASPQSDLYALGVAAYELATGNSPFPGEGPYGFPGEHYIEYPYRFGHEFKSLLMRMLAMDPGLRPVSAVECLLELERLGLSTRDALLVLPVERPTPDCGWHPREDDVTPPPVDDPGPSPRPRWLLGLSLVAAIAMGFWTWQMVGEPSHAPRTAELVELPSQFARELEPQPVPDELPPPDPDELPPDPDEPRWVPKPKQAPPVPDFGPKRLHPNKAKRIDYSAIELPGLRSPF